MKILLSLVVAFFASSALAGELYIDVNPSRGSQTNLEFSAQNGKFRAFGNGPFASSTLTSAQENKDGSIQGFILGTPYNLLCTATGCTDRGSTQIDLAITNSGDTTTYSGTIQHYPVRATVSKTAITVSTYNASFEAKLGKNNAFRGQGAFSRGRFGFFDVKLTPKDGFDLNDPRLFVLTVLSTFTVTK